MNHEFSTSARSALQHKLHGYQSDRGAYKIRLSSISLFPMFQSVFLVCAKSYISLSPRTNENSWHISRRTYSRTNISKTKNFSIIKCKRGTPEIPSTANSSLFILSSSPLSFQNWIMPADLRAKDIFISTLLDSGEHSRTRENLKYFRPPPWHSSRRHVAQSRSRNSDSTRCKWVFYFWLLYLARNKINMQIETVTKNMWRKKMH